MALEAYLVEHIYFFLLLFARVGAMILVLPGFSESFITPRARLTIALGLSIILLTTMEAPPSTSQPFEILINIAREVLIGLFLGLIGRFLMAAFDVAGFVIGMQTGLSNAFVMNPTMMGQGALTTVFFTLAATTAIFATDLHHLMIAALLESYTLFPLRAAIFLEDKAYFLANMLQESFLLGIKLSAPLLMVGLLFNLAIGLLSRLMPQIQIFFVAISAQIVLGFLVLSVSAGVMITFFLEVFENHYENFLGIN